MLLAPPYHRRQRKRVSRRSSFLTLLTFAAFFVAAGCMFIKSRTLVSEQIPKYGQPSWASVPTPIIDNSPSNGSEDLDPCAVAFKEVFTLARKQLLRWEYVTASGRIIQGFGNKASRLLNRTLAKFEAKTIGLEMVCSGAREKLTFQLQREIHGLFLTQRSRIEQELYQNLQKDLLKKMRRKRKDLDFLEKLTLLHAALGDYDSWMESLKPHFVEDVERDRAEKRFSELQWSIGDTPEAKEMKERWKMERLQRLPTRQSRGISVSLSPSFRLLFRPDGLGNFQISSKRLIGPPHNPSEVSIGAFNDGSVADIYNMKDKPPKIKLQPAIGVEMNVG